MEIVNLGFRPPHCSWNSSENHRTHDSGWARLPVCNGCERENWFITGNETLV